MAEPSERLESDRLDSIISLINSKMHKTIRRGE
nr:MAG TPA: hypothetical protein [Caudoviricetes sp.]